MSASTNDQPAGEWAPSVAAGVGALVVFAAYLAWVLTSGPTEGVAPIAGTTLLGVWVGSLALVHLTRASARWMSVPGLAALLAACIWLMLFIPDLLTDPSALARDAPLALVLFLPTAVPLLFGTAHVLAARGRPHRRVLVAAWLAVPVAVLCAFGFLFIALGHSGMGGG